MGLILRCKLFGGGEGGIEGKGGWNFPIGSAVPSPARLEDPGRGSSNKHRAGAKWGFAIQPSPRLYRKHVERPAGFL